MKRLELEVPRHFYTCIQFTFQAPAGAYIPEAFAAVKNGECVLGHADGGYNEYLFKLDVVANGKEILAVLRGMGMELQGDEYVIIDVTNETHSIFTDPKDWYETWQL